MEVLWRSYQIYEVVNEKGRHFDLRQHNKLERDELVILKPYDSFCRHGIDGFEENQKDWPMSMDDGEQFVLFLKNNKIVHEWKPSRGRIDFSSSDIPNRIKNENAVFDFEGNSSYVKQRQQ
ncbi:hypothetical protein [Bdellovibrio sp. HCB274]|uniref:hypothetical protein n=1 Tax=Bdellovibrio sp. HCB274 TaxID=3394361 RepID=UPI0039B3F440